MLLTLSMAGSAMAMPAVIESLLSVTGGSNHIPTAEWNALSFFQRIKAYDFTLELLVLATIGLYLFSHFWGTSKNQKMVNSWMDGARPALREQFAEVGCNDKNEVIKDTNARFTTYATGRENIASFLARLHLVDRHNIVLQSIGLFVPSLRSLDGLSDQVSIEITPMDPSSIEPAIFAIVHKDFMRDLRESKYYLSLCRTSESPRIPASLCFMTEHKDVIDSLLTPALEAAVNAAPDLVEYIAITDQREDAPEEVKDIAPKARVYASLRYPKNEEDKKLLGDLINAIVNLVDHLVYKKPLRSEVARKLKNSREEAILRIKRREEQARLDEVELKKAEERRAADRAMDKLSEKEQRKLLKKQQEKEQRKMQKKQQRIR